MSWPGCASAGCRCGRSPRGWAAARRRSAGSWPATPTRGPAATSPSGRTGWRGSGSGGPSRRGCRAPAAARRVQQLLDRRYSPEQASGRLKVLYPDDPAMRVSHETIYQSIYVYPRGELRRELEACLRTGPGGAPPPRRPRDPRPDHRCGADRPAAARGRGPPGARPPRRRPDHGIESLQLRRRHHRRAHHRLPHPAPAARRARRRHRRRRHHRAHERPAALVRQTLTWDRGIELARHQRVTAATGIQVYFADPYAPWQRGSNENINGLLREYLPKGTDLAPAPPPSSRPSPPNSTTAPANASATTPPPNIR